jgi:hypothetical protein
MEGSQPILPATSNFSSTNNGYNSLGRKKATYLLSIPTIPVLIETELFFFF